MSKQEKDQLRRLAAVVQALNTPRAGAVLRELVQLWQASGPNTTKFVSDHPDIWRECLDAWKPSIRPTTGGAWSINLVTNAGADGVMESLGTAGVRHKSIVFFNSLLANTLWSKLGGPCARCGKYFIRRRARLRNYCSTKCGWNATAVETTRRQRAAAREEKLQRAKVALSAWRKQHEVSDWKRFVASTTDIDLRFLTRAATAGDLQAPKGR